MQEGRRHAGPVLDEVLHADVEIHGPLAAAEPFGLDGQPFGQGQDEATADDVDEDGVDGARAVAKLDPRKLGRHGDGGGIDGSEADLAGEVLPNMSAPLLAEAGLRLTYSIGMVAGIGFLGFSTNPGAADWGQMINENRLALLVQPWAVLLPVIVIGVFTIGTNLLADGVTQVTGKGGR